MNFQWIHVYKSECVHFIGEANSVDLHEVECHIEVNRRGPFAAGYIATHSETCIIASD